MGGFTLIGSQYIFQNFPNEERCRCIGYTGVVNDEMEELLFKDPEKTLKLESLPDSVIASMEGFHLGEERRYSVKRRVATTTSASGILPPARVPFGGTVMDPTEAKGETNKSPHTIVETHVIRKRTTPWYRKS